MNPFELLERVAHWEDVHTEFKQAFESSEELAKDLVCLANTEGGQLIFGVAESREIVGIADVDDLMRTVEDVAVSRIEPPISVSQQVINYEGRRVVVVDVPQGDLRPYRTRSGRYYVRTAAPGCRQASRQELLRLFQAAGSLLYDESPLTSLSLADLDTDAVERYLADSDQPELIEDIPRLLRNWRLSDGAHPTVAGLVLFGRRPQQHLPFARIVAARFPGTDTGDDLLDRKDLDGRLLDVIESAEKFLDLHLLTPHRIRGFEREDHPELPKAALREAVVNAVTHRDYTVTGPVRLFVFADRVEVHTPGRPPNTVDAEAMRAGAHVVRNPHIYARLSDIGGLVTRAGTGVRRMSRLVREATGQDVGIKVLGHEVVFALPRPQASQGQFRSDGDG